MNDFLKKYGCILMVLGACLFTLYLRVDLRFNANYIFFGEPENSMPVSDARVWNILAANLVSGRGLGDYVKMFSAHNYYPPGHPFLLGLLYFYFGFITDFAHQIVCIGWVVAIIGSLLPLLGYLLAKEMFNEKVGCICAILIAVYLPYIRLGFSLMSESSLIFMSAVSLWLWARQLRSRKSLDAIIAGASIGFAGLVRPSAFAFLPALLPSLLYGRDVVLRKKMLLILLFAASAMIFPAGWMLRNWKVYGEPCLIYSSISARHAWTAAHPEYGPWFYSRDNWHETLWRDPYATELGMIKRLQAETREFIKANPVKYFAGAIWRMHLLFTIGREKDLKWTFGDRLGLETFLILILAIGGAFRCFRIITVRHEGGVKREIPGYIWCGSFIITLLVTGAGIGVYGGTDRYRWPLEFLLFPFAALGIYSILNIHKTSFVSRWELEEVIEKKSAWAKRLAGGAIVILVALMVVYMSGLIIARVNARNAPAYPVKNSKHDVLALIEKCGLAREFEKQQAKWITPQDMFNQQAQNFGKVTEFNNLIVAWTGRILFPQFHSNKLFRAVIVLNPKPGNFGGISLAIFPDKSVSMGDSEIKHEDIVTIIARIDDNGGKPAAPGLKVYAVLPGRFE